MSLPVVPKLGRAAALVAAATLVACGGGGEKPAAETPGTDQPAATTTAATPSAGEAMYQQRCMSCHQANGEGLPGTYPPLAGSEYATAANPGVPARIVLNGISGPIEVKGTTYNNLMPAYGVGIQMTDDEVASLLTYVRSSWGNAASPVTAADVAAAREATKGQSGTMTAELLKPLMK